MMTVALTTPVWAGFAPEERLSLLGVRAHKAGRPTRITPRDLCRAVAQGMGCVSASKKHPAERLDQRFDSTILISVATGSRQAPIGTPP